MERIKVSENFFLDEFIDIHTYLKSDDNGLSKIDNRLFDIAQVLRYGYQKPLYINTWWDFYVHKMKEGRLTCDEIINEVENSPSIRKWSGTRTTRCRIGASKSAHRVEVNGKGCAIDLKGDQKELFDLVEENAKLLYTIGLRRLEDPSITSGWLHVDTLERNTKPDSIRVVDLVKCTKTITW